MAWALVTLSVCWGLFISTKAVAKASSPAWLLDFHRYLGGLAVFFTGVHLAGLVGDNYVYFGWAELFLPMAADWQPGPVAFGIVAFYLLVAVEVTSLAMKRLPRVLWRWVHRSSFLLYFVATYHAIAAGTDNENQWFRISMKISCFEKAGANLRNIIAPLVVATKGAFKMSISDVRLVTDPPPESLIDCG